MEEQYHKRKNQNGRTNNHLQIYAPILRKKKKKKKKFKKIKKWDMNKLPPPPFLTLTTCEKSPSASHHLPIPTASSLEQFMFRQIQFTASFPIKQFCGKER